MTLTKIAERSSGRAQINNIETKFRFQAFFLYPVTDIDIMALCSTHQAINSKERIR